MTILQNPASEANYTKGRAYSRITHVVLHVEDGTEAGTDAWFQNPQSHVSAHYSIDVDGKIRQHVPEADTAWANGLPYPYRWANILMDPMFHVNPNAYTISIEHAGMGGVPWPDAQVSASIQLVADICRRNAITVEEKHVVGHHDIYAGHICPGAGCPMTRIIAGAAEIIAAEQ